MASHVNSFSTGNWEHRAHLARHQAERARRLAREFAHDRVSRDLMKVADELDEAADELDRRAQAFAAGMAPTTH